MKIKKEKTPELTQLKIELIKQLINTNNVLTINLIHYNYKFIELFYKE